MEPVIICVDDEETVLATLKEQIKFSLKDSISIELAESGEEALELLNELIKDGVEIPLVISDQIMPGLKGDKLLRQVHERLPKTLKILLTGQASANDVGRVVNTANLYRYIGKPWDETNMAFTVREAIRSYFQDKTLEKTNEELRKKIVAFYKFVPVQFLEMLNHKIDFEDITLGIHTECTLSVLFSDIRSFTQLSERITPKDNFRFLNSYLSHMGPIVRKNFGFIDKYIGDAIMGLFQNCNQALEAAIEMLQHLYEYNEGRQRAGYIPIEIGIGLNTGKLMLGTVGEDNRLDTTVIGDVVNSASRIESLTKTYGTPLIISESTFRALENPDKYAIRFIGKARVKGKEKPIPIFEVFDSDLPEVYENKMTNMETFNEAVTLYYQGEVKDSQKLFQACHDKNPEDNVARFYIELCQKKDRK